MNPVMKQARSALGESVSNADAAQWACLSLMRAVKGASWKVYKSCHIRSIEDDEERSQVRKIYQEHGRLGPGERRKRRKSKRKKELDKETVDVLFAELKKPNHVTWGKAARIWIWATRLTGLRPSEWRSAAIVVSDGARYLKCRNAKVVSWDGMGGRQAQNAADRGRVTAIYRYIPMEHLMEADQQIVAAQIASAAPLSDDQYELFYAGVRMSIYRAAKALWPGEDKLPTLYSARHAFRDSFEAQLRAERYSASEIDVLTSVVMGHGSRETKYAYGIGSEDEVPHQKRMVVEKLRAGGNVLLSIALAQSE